MFLHLFAYLQQIVLKCFRVLNVFLLPTRQSLVSLNFNTI